MAYLNIAYIVVVTLGVECGILAASYMLKKKFGDGANPNAFAALEVLTATIVVAVYCAWHGFPSFL